MNFYKYIEKIKGDFKCAVKIEWLNPDESVNFEFTNELYNVNVNIDVNYEQGCRRACTLTLNNDNHKFPVDFNNIWINQKFKVWMGIYLDDKTPYYLPQGVFYIKNPSDVYNPATRTLTITGVDKWAFFDGTLGGRLSDTYVTNIGVNIYDSIKDLISSLDPISPKFSPYFVGKKNLVPVWNEFKKKYINEEKEVLLCPYTLKVERGKTISDILLEYANLLCAHIYYDVNGRLVIEPMLDSADDITDTNKEILWDFTVDEKTFLGITRKYNFEKVHNDFIVLGNIVNGYQFKARVQNRNPMSDTCVQRIGLKTKEPYEDNQYYSDKQCESLAIYYAKKDTILQCEGSIFSNILYHLDVNKLVTVSTPNNNMSKELFLITGFSLPAYGTMSINVARVNILNNFSVVEVNIDEE